MVLDEAKSFSSRKATFQRTRRPNNNELNQLLDTLNRRIVRILKRRELLIADPERG